MTSASFSPPIRWEPLSAEQAESFLRELQREWDHRHPLYGLTLKPLARSTAADDVLWALPDGPVVIWIEQLRRSEHHNNETAAAEPHA